MTRLLTVAFVMVCCAPAAFAQAEGEDAPLTLEAEKHFNAALAHYSAKRYADAAVEFGKAYELDPRPKILFAWAQAERLGGNCKNAIELYHRLRQQEIPKEDKLAVLEGLDRCNAFDQPEPKKPRVTAEPKQPAVDNSEREGSPWYSDWLGNALVVSGVVGVGVGTSFWFISSSQHSDAADSRVYDEHVELEDRAKRNRVIAIVGLTAGAALVAGGVTRYLTRDTATESEDTAVSAGGWVTTSGVGLAVGGRF